MSDSRISSKGQVTIPKAIRMRMHWKVGDRLRFVIDADGSLRLAAATRDVLTLRDILPAPPSGMPPWRMYKAFTPFDGAGKRARSL